jgi:Zn-dependent protease
LSFGPDQIQHAILYLIAFILSITVHEFGHAWLANRLGDSTPKVQGRLTLSPLHHIDPIGTILMPLIMGFSAASSMAIPLLAWGRPVETNPSAYSRRFSLSTGRMLVSLAGPMMNLMLAIVVSIILIIASHLGAPNRLLGAGFHYLIQLNLSLMIFNLLPIPPLDGGSVLAWILPRSMQHIVDFLARWGGFILLFLVISPSLGLPLLNVVGYPITVLSSIWATVLSYLL